MLKYTITQSNVQFLNKKYIANSLNICMKLHTMYIYYINAILIQLSLANRLNKFNKTNIFIKCNKKVKIKIKIYMYTYVR